MSYRSELEKICVDLYGAISTGDAMLKELGKPSNSMMQMPELIHVGYMNLSTAYAAVDIELKVLFEDSQQIDANPQLYTELATFHKHNQMVQMLMSYLSTAYKLLTVSEASPDTSGMEAWRDAFCKYYPDVLQSTKALSAITSDLRREYDGLTNMTTVYASPEMMKKSQSRHKRRTPYPFNHAEEPNDLSMNCVYNSPQMTIDRIVADDYTISPDDEVVFGEDETIIFCPRCGKAMPGSKMICPYCGLVLR